MPNELKKITALPSGTPADNDVIPFVDLATNTTKKALKSELKGDKGDTGTAATVDAGTTTTLAAGQSASVTNIGTPSAAIFNFAIPQGIQGIPGADGADGACVESVSFVGNDIVFVLDDASTVTLTNAKVTLKGDKGDTGAKITSAEFVGNDLVFTLDDSSTVTVTGAKTALKGDKGDTGDIGIDWQGAWSSGTYTVTQAVSHNGSSWIAKTTTTEEPSISATDWDLIALKGTDGTGTGDISGSGTANELAYFTAEKTIDNLPVATYPNLTELSYVKGVTSSVQTQIDDKAEITSTVDGDYSVSSDGCVLYHPLTADTILHASDISEDKNPNDTNNGTLTNFARNNGTVSGGVTISDGAMVFDGAIGTQVSAANPINENTNSFSFWYYANEIENNNGFLGNDNQTDRGFCFYMVDVTEPLYRIQMRKPDDSGWYKDIQFGTPKTGQWVHIAIVQDGNNLNIYENNINILSTTGNGNTIRVNSQNLYIGRGYYDNSAERFLDGSMTNVLYFNRALTTTEITEIYNAGKDSYSPIGLGLVAQYSGRDFAGTEAVPTTIYDTNMIVKGQFDEAVNFKLGNYISVSNTGNIKTLSFWANINTSSVQHSLFINNGDNNLFGIRTAGYYSIYYDGAWTTTTATITLNEYQHIMYIHDGTGYKIYINNVYKDRVDVDAFSIDRMSFTSNSVRGSLSNVLILNEALTDEERTALYNRQKTYFTDNNPAGRLGDIGIKGDMRLIGSATIDKINYAEDAGSTDNYVITLDPAPSSLTTGMSVIFKANTANTGAATLNVNGLGAKAIVKGVSTALSDNDILADMFCSCVFDGTNFVLLNPRAL